MNKQMLGFEEAHEDTTPEMYNEPCVSGNNLPNRSGIAPMNRKDIGATVLHNDILYYLGEDDCHYFEKGKLNPADLPKLIDDFIELESLTVDGKIAFNRNNRWVKITRKDKNDLVHIAMGEFILTCDVYWIPSVRELLEQTLTYLQE